MVAVADDGRRVSLAAVQLGAWHDAADYLVRLAGVTGRPELAELAHEVRLEGEELLAPVVVRERALTLVDAV